MTCHLAAVNIGKVRYPLEDLRMADFVDNLEYINGLGDKSPGAVWRYQTIAGDATAERIFDDTDIILNLTVWLSVDALREYTYKSEHSSFLRRRREWFVPLDGWPVLALWWIAEGTTPTLADAKARLALLRDDGPTAEAFTFRDRFPPP